METGTFQKIGSGDSVLDAIRPDFSILGYTPVMWESMGETSVTMTVRYQEHEEAQDYSWLD
jgi:hypothetical protein